MIATICSPAVPVASHTHIGSDAADAFQQKPRILSHRRHRRVRFGKTILSVAGRIAVWQNSLLCGA